MEIHDLRVRKGIKGTRDALLLLSEARITNSLGASLFVTEFSKFRTLRIRKGSKWYKTVFELSVRAKALNIFMRVIPHLITLMKIFKAFRDLYTKDTTWYNAVIWR